MANANPGGIYGNNMISQPQIVSTGPQFQSDASAVNPIGGKVRWNNAILRYVKHNTGTSAVTPLAGAPAYVKTLTPAATATAVPVFTVTADQSDSVIGVTPVGVFMQFTTAPATNTYIWIQIGGVANCIVAGAVTGEKVIGSTSDLQFDRISDIGTSTYTTVGKVAGSSSATLSPVLLQGMDW